MKQLDSEREPRLFEKGVRKLIGAPGNIEEPSLATATGTNTGKGTSPYSYHENLFHKMLHNETAFAIQRRLQWKGFTVVILPICIDLRR